MADGLLYDRSREPLYLQAAGQLRLKIERGVWGPGAQLPVIEQLQAEFGLSRATIREALDILERDRLIERHRGRGTFVRAQLPERRSHVLPTTWADLVASLRTIEPKLLTSFEHRDGAELRGALAGRAEGRFVWYQRVHSRDGEPYCLIDIHLREDVFEQDRERFLSTPVVLVLAERHADTIASVHQRVSFSIADEASARALGIALGAPVAEILRTLVDGDGATLAHTYARYPGEYVRVDFHFTTAGPPRTVSGSM